jgi:MFS family permease
MNEKISKRNLLIIVFISLAGQIAWQVENQYYNVFLYNEIAPVPMYISIMVAASAITATITSIVMGAFSDRRAKRKPFLIAGFILWTITTAIFPLAAFVYPIILAVVFAIMFDCIMTFFGSTAYDATFNAYVTDITTLENRGKAVGVVEVMTLIAILIVYGISGFIILAYGYYNFFYIVGILVGIFGITGAIFAKEPENLKKSEIGIFQQIKHTFKSDSLRENKDFFLVLTGAAIWGIGFNIFFPFIIIYLQHYIGLSIAVASIVIFFALLISIILAFPLGILIDKIGRKKFLILSVILESIFLILFSLFTDIVTLLIFGICWIFAMTMFHISSNTWIKDLYPEEKRGQFSGYFILFTVLFAMVPGPLIGGWLASEYGKPIVIEGVSGMVPTPILFQVAAIVILFAIIPIIFAKEYRKKE